LLKVIPNGWKYPRICRAKITLGEHVHKPVDFVETPWFMTADITFQGEVIGEVAIYYSEKKPRADEGPFLETERRLLNAIAERVGFSVLLRRIRGARARIESVRESITARDRHASGIVTEFLRSTDGSTRKKSTILIKSLENPGTGLAEMAEAIERYQSAGINDADLPQAVRSSLRVALLRKYFVESLDFINVAKNYVSVDDFYDLAQSVIHPARSQGKLGGKGAGIFLASRILKKSDEHADLFANLKIPKTWYIASDGLLDFIHRNDLEELYNTKYMEIERSARTTRTSSRCSRTRVSRGHRQGPELGAG
jgi:hypothetical protein